MATRRFDRLERERAADDGSRASPSRPSAVESRFGEREAPGPASPPARSGADAVRFEEAAEERLRVRDTDDGLSFVRCAHCRADNYPTAARCTNCEADLDTPGQRAFNEALFRKHVADREEEKQQLEALKERRALAEREQAEAMRQREALEGELSRRRERGLPLDEADDVSDPLRAGARSVGGLIGQALARWLPDPTTRLVVLGAAGIAVAFVIFTSPRLLYGVFWLAVILGAFGRRRRWRRF
jgi:hypothetical protein